MMIRSTVILIFILSLFSSFCNANDMYFMNHKKYHSIKKPYCFPLILAGLGTRFIHVDGNEQGLVLMNSAARIANDHALRYVHEARSIDFKLDEVIKVLGPTISERDFNDEEWAHGHLAIAHLVISTGFGDFKLLPKDTIEAFERNKNKERLTLLVQLLLPYLKHHDKQVHDAVNSTLDEIKMNLPLYKTRKLP